MNKNTRWALALVGVAIIIVAVLFISKGDDNTDATQTNTPTESTTQPSTAGTGATGATGSPGNGGATSGDNSGGATSGSGGVKPDDNGTGGAKPDDNGTGGATVSSEQGPLLVAGKVAKITVDEGDTVRVRARSATDDELHIHGYDYSVDLPAGKTVSYKFKADIGGSFEMEFENKGLQVAALKVNP